jgi:single-strand DNA-binding protein
MPNYNRTILMGHLTRDIELRYAPSGVAVANFGLAVNRRFKQGEDLKEEVCFIDIVAFGKQAETVSQYLAKGSAALVEGRLKLESWETDGQKRSKHVVVAEQVTFLDKKGGAHE